MNQVQPANRQSDNRKRNILFFLLTLIVLSGLFFLLYNETEKRTKQALVELLNSNLSDDSEFVIEHLKIKLFPFGFTAENITLNHYQTINEREPAYQLDYIRKLEIEKITVKRFQLFHFLRTKGIRIDEIAVHHPKIELLSNFAEHSSERTSDGTIPNLYISDFLILDGEASIYQGFEYEMPILLVRDVSASVTDIDIEFAREEGHSGRTYDFSGIELETGKMDYRTSNKHYELFFDSIYLNSFENAFRIETAEVNPLLNAHELGLDKGYQSDRFDVRLSGLAITDFDFKALVKEGTFTAAKVELTDPMIQIDRDRSLPRKAYTEDRILPHLQLKQLSVPIHIDTVHAINGYLNYHEFYSADEREGFVTFSQIDLKAFPFQNISDSDSLFIRSHAKFMDIASLNLQIDFSLEDDAAHIMSGTLGSMDLTAINEPLEDLVLLRLQKGELEQLNFWFYADNNAAAGNLVMIYNNLEVRFLDDSTTRERRRDRFRSFIANTFAVRSNNPAENPRNGTIEYDRNPERSMFSYWLRSLATGLEDSVKRI